MYSCFTVYFEGPFWVGVLERLDESGYAVARHVFGGEPGDAELSRFISERLPFLRIMPAELPDRLRALPVHPDAKLPSAKRLLREARKHMNSGLSSYAHVAIQAGLKELKTQRKNRRREERERENAEAYALRHAKAKKKARGH